VAGVEYAYEGLPPELPARVPVGFVFSNRGEEVHEFVLLRRAPGETVDDVVHLREAERLRRADESFTNLTREPGGVDSHIVRLRPGDYVAVCSIPVGTRTFDTPGSGPPHAEEGMIAEVAVG
jgi:hypothetical protein